MLHTVWFVDRYLNFDLNFLLIRIDSEIPFSKNLHHTETNQRICIDRLSYDATLNSKKLLQILY